MAGNLRECWVRKEDKRLNPRIDFHLDVIVRGSKGVKRVTNFSTGGFFIELDESGLFKRGDRIEIVTKLPLEKRIMIIKGQVAHATTQGIGVKFMDLWGPNSEAVESNFQVFRATIPFPAS